MIHISKGEYVIVQPKSKDTLEKSKPILVKVASKLDEATGTFNGRVEKDTHLSTSITAFRDKDVIISLGKHPFPGRVLGFNLATLYRRTEQEGAWGEIHYFCEPDDENKRKFLKGLNSVHAKLDAAKLWPLVESANFVMEVVPKNGKYSGMYCHSPRPDDHTKPSRVKLVVNSSVLSKASLSAYSYVAAHELGHLLDFNYVDAYPNLDREWIKLYTTSIAPRRVDKARCAALFDEVLAHENLKSFLGNLEEDHVKEAKLVLRWIREVHGLNSKELFALITDSSKKSANTLHKVWPRNSIYRKDLSPILTEYACKNRRELFAETFAFHLLGKQVPKELAGLMEETLSTIIRGNK